MNLTNYQKDAISKIYNFCLHSDATSLGLFGKTGIGKSTILLGLKDSLKENWTAYYIKGVDKNLGPYVTWHIGVELFSREMLDSNITFGTQYIPIPFSIDLNLKKNYENYVLNLNEIAIIEELQSSIETNENILIIADNYHEWDYGSKKLLNKIDHLKNVYFHNVRFKIICCESNNDENYKFDEIIQLNEIPKSDIREILDYNQFFDVLDLQMLIDYTDYNINLMLLIAEYYHKNNELEFVFESLIHNKILQLGSSSTKICSTLENTSIINGVFTNEMSAFLNDSTLLENEMCLERAKGELLLEGYTSYSYKFSSIKNFFVNKLELREKYLHSKLCTFLQKHHPEDYYTRANHLLRSSMDKFEKGIQSFYLCSIEKNRRSIAFNLEDDQNLQKMIESSRNLLSPINKSFIESNMEKYESGIELFYNEKFNEAMILFRSIDLIFSTKIFESEVIRFILLCAIQLRFDYQLIIQYSTQLYQLNNTELLNEDEQWCRNALVLLLVYVDCVYDLEKVSDLKREFNIIIQRHMQSPFFMEMHAAMSRRSIMFYPEIIASGLLRNSVAYYQKQNNKRELYKALCNALGNAIVVNNLNEAKIYSDELKNVMFFEKEYHFSSQYKYHNNTLIYEYLEYESSLQVDYKKYSTQLEKKADEIFTRMNNVLHMQKEEGSMVMYMNLICFAFLSNKLDLAKEYLDNVDPFFIDNDSFYLYYFNNLWFCYYMLMKDFNNSDKYLNKMNQVDSPLLLQNNRMLTKRLSELRKIVNEELHLSPQELNNIISERVPSFVDSSWAFWGRAFILSDLQFLSF